MTDDDLRVGPLDVPTLELLGERTSTHPAVATWSFEPDPLAPRRLVLALETEAYPEPVSDARLRAEWYVGGAYSFEYVESRDDDRWRCRWERHPTVSAPEVHYHLPPRGDERVAPGTIQAGDPLGIAFAVLDRILQRRGELQE